MLALCLFSNLYNEVSYFVIILTPGDYFLLMALCINDMKSDSREAVIENDIGLIVERLYDSCIASVLFEAAKPPT